MTGEELRVEPFVGYLRAKLEDAGLLDHPLRAGNEHLFAFFRPAPP